ncbi:D-alanyl-D-alanine carboxypeptidase/D-alanyl-D-alanine endopeptidase [Desertibacillus haloalkaliphilus]|uniref:D-alanyl-D-alanine carboxypeptidase/D-alanyl-D-alanine endopeptidase n=1 Tax=Desertibacillus haloalkaliphilus TaxID=1328930 RepID=UPI001FEAC117
MFAVALPVQAQITDVTFGGKIEQLLQENDDLDGAIASISVRDATTGKLLYDHLGDLRLRPASNLKLVTAAAALEVLGEDYVFSTELFKDGERFWKLIIGNVYIKGKGDPSLVNDDFNELAAQLRERGVSYIHGDLVADDTWYDDVRYSIDLPWSDETAPYGGQVSALTASASNEEDVGTVTVEVRPGKELGEKATVTLCPKNNYVSIKNQTNTVDSGHAEPLTVERIHGTNTVVISGEVAITSDGDTATIAIWEPTGFALDLFKHALQEQGIRWRGDLRFGETPDGTDVLYSHVSKPLAEQLVPFLKHSFNGYGEMFIKEIGRISKGEGSWDAGIDVVEEVLIRFGVDPKTVVIRDGSGISHVNLIPANELTNLLYAIQDQSWYPTFLNALPVAGASDKEIGGTLSKRMNDLASQGNVRAKTGTISTVSSLSGYVTTKSGDELIFSIILNNLTNGSKAKAIEDKIATILANA